MDFKMVDNKGENTLINILKDEIKAGSKIAIASAYFSLFAYHELKKELEKSKEFRFLYTKPTFYKKEADLKRQYKISQNHDVSAEQHRFRSEERRVGKALRSLV